MIKGAFWTSEKEDCSSHDGIIRTTSEAAISSELIPGVLLFLFHVFLRVLLSAKPKDRWNVSKDMRERHFGFIIIFIKTKIVYRVTARMQRLLATLANFQSGTRCTRGSSASEARPRAVLC